MKTKYPFNIRQLSNEEGVSLNTLVIMMLSESLAFDHLDHGKLAKHIHIKNRISKKEKNHQ